MPKAGERGGLAGAVSWRGRRGGFGEAIPGWRGRKALGQACTYISILPAASRAEQQVAMEKQALGTRVSKEDEHRLKGATPRSIHSPGPTMPPCISPQINWGTTPSRKDTVIYKHSNYAFDAISKP